MNAIFFEKPEDFRKWLEENHETKSEIIVGFYKNDSKKTSISWSEAVDQALCFGWIDSVRRSIDSESYSNRFTPRRANSIWSAVNIQKIENLTAKNLMKPAGIAAFEKRRDSHSKVYSFENEDKVLTAELEKLFKANKKAWEFFNAQPPGYKKLNIFRIMSAKQEKTQLARLEKLIAVSELGKRID